MAELVGGLPIIDVPYAVGELDTYPLEAETIDGDPIPPEDNLFPEPDVYSVSDVGEVVWWMGVEESTTNTLATSYEMGASASITVSGVKVGGGGSLGWGEAYSLGTGAQCTFAGSIPTLRDNPDTPEDEYALYQYSLKPYVYLHRYDNADGDESAFYVQTYELIR